MKKVVYWSAGELSAKTMLAVRRAESEKDRVVLVDFKEIVPDIHRYYSIPYKPKAELVDLLKSDRSAVNNYLDRKGKLHVFTGFDISDSMRFGPKDMLEIINSLDFDTAVFDVNGGVCYSSTYAALKTADEIIAVMEPCELSYYSTAVLIDFIVKYWNINRDIISGVIAGRGNVELAREITGLSSIVRAKI